MKDYERRFISSEAAQLRLEHRDDGAHLVGLSIPYNSRSVDLGGFVEVMLPGAFRKSLQEADILALWQHDDRLPLARTSNDTLKLTEDKSGVRHDIRVPKTTTGSNAVILIGDGTVKGMSFGFEKISDRFYAEGELVVREVQEAKLIEVSPVTKPAYESTHVSLRALDQVREVLEKTKPEPLTAEGLIERLKAEGLTPAEIRSILVSGSELLAPDPARQAAALERFVRHQTLEINAGMVPVIDI